MKNTVLPLFLTVLLLPSVPWAQATAKKSLVGVSGWVVFYDEGGSLQDFEKYAPWTDRAYLLAYRCGDDGLPAPIAEATDALRARAVAAARKGKCQPWITIEGWGIGDNNGREDNGLEKMLQDDALRQQHIAALVALAKKDQVDGIQIKYWNMKTRDRGKFSGFLGELAAACHQSGLLLGAVVFEKNEQYGGWWGPAAFDYGAIGRVVDEMVADPNQGHGDIAGALADLTTVEVSMRYMTSVVPASKTEVRALAGGYDWVGATSQDVSWAQFQGLLQQYKTEPSRDTKVSQELHLDYPPNHKVWFSDAKAVEFTADIAKRAKSYGIAFWRFGGEGLEFWQMVQRVDSTSQTTTSSDVPAPGAEPGKLQPVDIYTDRTRLNAPWAAGGQYPDVSNITAFEKNGKYWLGVKLNSTVWSNFGIHLTTTNLKPYLEHGAFQFYIRGMQGGEDFKIGFTSAPGASQAESHSLNNEIPLSGYGETTTKWRLVTIPLSDFPAGGHYWNAQDNKEATQPFNWERVDGFIAERAASGGGAPVEFELSNMRVVPFYK